MKKSNSKKVALKADAPRVGKIIRKAKPLVKRVLLKCLNKNPNRGVVAPLPPQPLLTKEGKGVVNGRSGGVFRRGTFESFVL